MQTVNQCFLFFYKPSSGKVLDVRILIDKKNTNSKRKITTINSLKTALQQTISLLKF